MGILNVKINLDKIVKKKEDGSDVYDLYKAFEDYKEEGRKEGELQTLIMVVKNLMKNQTINFEAASQMAGISIEKQKEIRPLI